MDRFLEVIVQGLLVRYLYVPASTRTGVVLFLHGWRSEATVWKIAMDKAASSGYDAYAIDLPGFGGSPAPKGTFGVADYATIVTGFIHKLGLGPVALVGHSFGGRIALYLSAAEPTVVKKLVLVDSAGIRPHSTRLDTLAFLARIIKPLFSPPFMQPIRRFFYRLIGAEDYLVTPALKDTFVKVVKEDLLELLPKVIPETLVVWGAQDRDTPLSDGRLMAERIPHARLVVFPNAGHLSFLDEPERFGKELVTFLS
jgi:pimeloyl-ACP methyl ester carboxylesterase